MHSEADSPEIKLIAQACCASLFLISRERWELEQKNSFQEGLVQLSISTSISLLCIKKNFIPVLKDDQIISMFSVK